MRILLLHQAIADDAPPDERDVLVQAAHVTQGLLASGHEVTRLPVTLELAKLREALIAAAPDCVFNLVESLDGADRLMVLVPAQLEYLRQRYTGATAQAILRTNNKVLAKAELRAAGLPTPDWATINEGTLRAPYIVKAISEHASLGLDEAAIIRDDAQSIAARIQTQASKLSCDCFAEAFIAGREFNLAMLAGPTGPQVLPVAEIDFSAFAPEQSRIVGYAAKWDEASFEYAHTPRKFVDGEPELCEQLRMLARRCWELFGLRGYARVDFRVDAAGQPSILEVNCNPCLSPDAGFAAALARANIAWEDAVQRIVADS
ncbi:MAG TPA: hypothetical protein VL096_14905 [Pirellulaceae bacterium]|nr:hypothetical protein [Pirellulaceae bacterium]